MAYVKTTWVDDETVVTADNMNHIEDGIKNLESVSLLAVSDTAPSECVEGDLYYNTITKKIYQAIDTDTWDSDGTDPLDKILYIVFSTKTTYSLDENGDLISVGGGGAEIEVSTTEPTEEEKIWINPNESVNVYGSYISNEYGTSQAIGYSQEYVNNLIKHTTITGTTDSNGFVSSTNMSTSNKLVLNAIFNSSSGVTASMIIPYIDSSTWTFKILHWDMQPKSNVSVSIEVYYIEI